MYAMLKIDTRHSRRYSIRLDDEYGLLFMFTYNLFQIWSRTKQTKRKKTKNRSINIIVDFTTPKRIDSCR